MRRVQRGDGTSSAAPSSEQLGKTPPPPSPPSPFTDTLVVVGKAFGWGIFTVLSFFLSNAFHLIVYALKKKPSVKSEEKLVQITPDPILEKVEKEQISVKDLYKIETFETKLQEDSFLVIMLILKLLNENPEEEGILYKLAGAYKKNINQYNPYYRDVKSQKTKRQNFIVLIHDIIQKCILSPEQQSILKRFVDGEEEVEAIGNARIEDGNWSNTQRDNIDKGIQLLGKYQSDVKPCIDHFNRVWREKILTLLKEDDRFNDLSIGSESEIIRAIPEERGLLPHGFIERFFYKTDGSPHNPRKLKNLQNEKTFNMYADILAHVLSIFREEDISPRLNQMCDLLNEILTQPQKRTRLFELVSNLIAIFR